MENSHSPKVYTVAEAILVFGIGRTKLYELIKGGRIDARKLGRRTLIGAASLSELFQSLPKVSGAQSQFICNSHRHIGTRAGRKR